MKDITTEINRQVGANFKLKREETGFSQVDVSIALGLSRCSVMNIESGRQGVNTLTLLKACKLFKCPVTNLLDIDVSVPLNHIPFLTDIDKKRMKIERLSLRLEELKKQLTP